MTQLITADNPYTDLPFYADNLAANGGKWDASKNIYEFTSNPIAIVHFTDDKRNTYQTFGNVYGEYGFLRDKSLRFRTNVGVDISFSHNKNFAQNFGDDDDSDPANFILARDEITGPITSMKTVVEYDLHFQ